MGDPFFKYIRQRGFRMILFEAYVWRVAADPLSLFDWVVNKRREQSRTQG